MDLSTDTLSGMAVALGVGLLIGVVRERRRIDSTVHQAAGVRTHALLALTGAVAVVIDLRLLLVAVGVVGALAMVAYYRANDGDLGLTGEIAMLLSLLLGGLAVRDAVLASALGVVVATLLVTKKPLHRFSRELLSTTELEDLLLLGAAALVIWPLLPDRTLDPWGAINPATIWKYVVLVMAIGAAGHVALRVVGARWGLPMAGFFSGFASSTAATAGFGQRARLTPALRMPAVAAALLSNLASHLLFVVVVGIGSMALLKACAWPLAGACTALLVGGGVGMIRAPRDEAQLPDEPSARAFKLSWALTFGAVITVVLLVAAWLQEAIGDSGALLAAGIAALVELHAAAATVTQLSATGSLSVEAARWGIIGLLAASGIVKSVVAFTAGGVRYGAGVAGVLVSSVAIAAALVIALPV